MKLLTILLFSITVFAMGYGCSTNIFPKTIKSGESKCSANGGVEYFRIFTPDSANATVVCKNGARFTYDRQ